MEVEWDQRLADSCSVDTMRRIALEAQCLPDDWPAFDAYAANQYITVNQVVNACQYAVKKDCGPFTTPTSSRRTWRGG